MKHIYKLTILILMLPSLVKAQVNIFSFKVKDQYLQNGKILIKNNSATTTIVIEINFTTARDQGIPKPGSIKTRLGTFSLSSNNYNPIFLSEQEEVKHTDFIPNELILKKEYTIDIQKSKLTDKPILLYIQPNGSPEGEYTTKSYNYVVEASIPEISNNLISLSAPFSSVENINVDGTIAQGGNGVFQTTWKVVDNNGNIINNIDGVTSLANKWTKDNIFNLPIQNSGEVYLSRVLTSGGKVSESNKVLISNWDGNFSSLNVRIKGPLVRYNALSENFVELPQGTEINYNELAPAISGRNPVDGDIYIGYSPDIQTHLTIINPTSGINYRWHYMMEGIAHADFDGSGSATGTSQVGNSIVSLSFPRYGIEYDQIHIYGSDGSRKLVFLTKVNQLVN